ncbi:MAG: hypothetical protein AABY22_17215 [Nanoarchaeota archaeon]
MKIKPLGQKKIKEKIKKHIRKTILYHLKDSYYLIKDRYSTTKTMFMRDNIETVDRIMSDIKRIL